MVFERIRNLREDNDKKQQELADYLNVKQTTYSKYELGKVNIPIEVFMKLADYYDVSVAVSYTHLTLPTILLV